MNKKGYIDIDFGDILNDNSKEDFVCVYVYKERLYKLIKNIKIYTLLVFFIFSCIEFEFNNLTILEYILSNSFLTLTMGIILGVLLTSLIVFKLLLRKTK